MSAGQVEEIRRYAGAAYPLECCGIVFGKVFETGERVVTRLEPAENAFDGVEERRRRFSIAPMQLMRAEKHAAERGEMVIGFYHSHPDHSCKPSEFDRERAWAFYSYLIASETRGAASAGEL